jgi:hypothetical protein
LETIATSIASLLFLDVLLFKGMPFVIGGLAALAFRAGIAFLQWEE